MDMPTLYICDKKKTGKCQRTPEKCMHAGPHLLFTACAVECGNNVHAKCVRYEAPPKPEPKP